jgi:hypothetical protein
MNISRLDTPCVERRGDGVATVCAVSILLVYSFTHFEVKLSCWSHSVVRENVYVYLYLRFGAEMSECTQSSPPFPSLSHYAVVSRASAEAGKKIFQQQHPLDTLLRLSDARKMSIRIVRCTWMEAFSLAQHALSSPISTLPLQLS